MRVTISKSKNAEQIYITKAYRDENGKSTSRIFKKLGSMASLLPEHDNDRDKVIAWAKEQAKIYTELEKNDSLVIPVEFSESKQLSFEEINQYEGGYIFLKKILDDLGIKPICDSIAKKYNFEYDLSDILSNLVYARILNPTSKLSSYEYMQKLIEKPTFGLHDIYRSLDVIDKESDSLQAMLYKNSGGSRNTSILYYDCTNFFFEIEAERSICKYGKSKEHRPNPIVQMGLFLDGDGIPLAFTIFPGNENEQPTLIPLEKKILKDFKLSKFIVCTDAGLCSYVNRKFNNRGDRSYVVTQPLKKLKEHLREWALSPTDFHLANSNMVYDISKIDEEKHRDDVFFKERWINENGLEQRLIVSFSPKHKAYQREVRNRQIERAQKIVEGGKLARTNNMNSPSRLVNEINTTEDGEVAQLSLLNLDTDKISEEEKYDGYYAVCTTLNDDVQTIIKINRRRWEIEESFRIMKSEFKARPVYLRNDERIRAHFMTCFLSLLVFRTLEKRLDEKYTANEIIKTLREMRFQMIKGVGYIPCYTRTMITDALHTEFGFRTDNQIITEQKMKKILKSS